MLVHPASSIASGSILTGPIIGRFSFLSLSSSCSSTFPPVLRVPTCFYGVYMLLYFLLPFRGCIPRHGFPLPALFLFLLLLFLLSSSLSYSSSFLFIYIWFFIFPLPSSPPPPPPLPSLLPLSCDDSVKSISLPLLFTVITILIYLLTFAITLAFPVDTFATLLDWNK